MSAEGRLVAGRYRLQKRIGSGAMGVVWRAVDERLQRTVAAKQLLLQSGHTQEETEEARQRSMREGRIAARLQHQNAIAVFDVAEDEGQPVLVMEYLPSQSLAGLLSEQGPVPPVSIARIGAQVAGALAAAHTAGIVHRDLKPGNILLGDTGIAKITDFGISRAVGDVSVTKSGILAGTPAYLSPEVALGRDPAPASDVFSLGSTLYAAIEGEPPFGVDENAISLLHRVARGQAEPPKQAGPMTPVLMQLLRPDPADRPTMTQARGLLQAAADGRPVPGSAQARPPGQPPPVRREAPAAAGPPAKPVSANHQAANFPAANPPAAHPPAAQQRNPAGNPAASPRPATNLGAPAQTGEPARGSKKSQRALLLWIMAVIIAILVGVLAANAYGGQADQSGGEPGQGERSREAPAAQAPMPQVPAAAPESTDDSTTTRPTGASRPPGPSDPGPGVSPQPKQPSRDEVVNVVGRYFSLVPKHLDESWELLGPGLRAQGKDTYEHWWKSVDDVKVLGRPKLVGSNVQVTLMYKDGGKRQVESHVLSMVVDQNGNPLINTDNRRGR